LLGGSTKNSVGKRELDLRVEELLRVGSSDFGSGDVVHRKDLNAAESGSVSSRQILVHLLNGTDASDVSVFLVDVGGSGSGIVSKDDAKVLHHQGLLLKDLSIEKSTDHPSSQ